MPIPVVSSGEETYWTRSVSGIAPYLMFRYAVDEPDRRTVVEQRRNARADSLGAVGVRDDDTTLPRTGAVFEDIVTACGLPAQRRPGDEQVRPRPNVTCVDRGTEVIHRSPSRSEARRRGAGRPSFPVDADSHLALLLVLTRLRARLRRREPHITGRI